MKEACRAKFFARINIKFLFDLMVKDDTATPPLDRSYNYRNNIPRKVTERLRLKISLTKNLIFLKKLF